MERNCIIGEVARQLALQEAARALAGPQQHTSTKLQVGEQSLLDASAFTSPGRPPVKKTPPFQPSVNEYMQAIRQLRLRNIVWPHRNDILVNDVLVNNALEKGDLHVGNIQFNNLINSQKLRYLLQTNRNGRENVAKEIVRAIRALDPPGRFLQKNGRKYDDIGEPEAIVYTAHALHQGTHEIAHMIANSSEAEVRSFFAAAADAGKLNLDSIPSGSLAATAAPPHPTLDAQGTRELANMLATSTATEVPSFFAAAAAVAGQGSLAATAAPPPPPPPPLDAIALLLASSQVNPPPTGEAAIRNAMLPQSRGDTAFDAIAKPMNIGNLSSNVIDGEIEKLKAKILTTRVRLQANAAQMAEEARRVASLTANSSQPRLVAPTTQMSLLSASSQANPPPAAEAAIRNAMLPQSRGDTAFDAIVKAMNIGHLGNNAANQEIEKLAAEIMNNSRVTSSCQTNAARLTEAAGRVASLPANASTQRLVAPATRMPTLGRGLPNIPLPPDAGGLGHDLSPSVASQLVNIPIQRTLNPLPATRQCGVSSQLEEGQKSNSNGKNQLSCSKDLVDRLVFAETMAQRTVQGTVTDALKAEEKRMGLYLDAGLLGIDYGEMMERRKRGQSEECILEEYYAKLRRKRDHDNDYRDGDDGDKKMRESKEPPAKKMRNVTIVNGRVQDSDALNAVGAMIQLQRQATSDCETETESESDSS